MTVPDQDSGERWLAFGLLLTTFATLLLELLDSRLLSVLTWYHLSFLAVSLAMLGGAAGAVLVYVGGHRFQGGGGRRALARSSLLLALVVPATHYLLLQTRIPPTAETGEPATLALTWVVVLLTLPFVVSGMAVTLALTRCGGRIGILYGNDLVGAAAGCLAILPLLHFVDAFTAVLFAAAIAALGALAFVRSGGGLPLPLAGGVAVLLAAGALLHLVFGSPVQVAYPRGRAIDRVGLAVERWNPYSQVRVHLSQEGPPFYWGKGDVEIADRVDSALLLIDGTAGTPLTKWDGRRESLDWVQYDVTALPYHLRSGHAAVIGVGGGRDILSALWGGSRVTGVEINGIIVDLHRGQYRDFTKIAEHPDVDLVNDEGRAYLSRTAERFDVLQMSLVDTWAATGAGAFTLTENALYTVEGWKTFLARLAPEGLFSTSRWFSPENVSETSRLLALCVTALLEIGVEDPQAHVALVSRGRVATLLVSPDPLRREDLDKIDSLAQRLGFDVLIAPGTEPSDPALGAILASRSAAELERAIEDPHFDYSAPRDGRPYFFNMLKFGSFYELPRLPSGDVLFGTGGVVWGNIRATATLVTLFFIALGLSFVILALPLGFSGLPGLGSGDFVASLGYFSLIGYGFMSVQIPLLQRFSVFLGHPIYTYSIILFTMILFAGIGSFLSERIALGGKWHLGVPLAIAAAIGVLQGEIEWLTGAFVGEPILVRCGLVVLCVAPVSCLLGLCFPLGMRTVSGLSEQAAPWMWAANGASGVIASIVAVGISMWAGIQVNLLVAMALYALLAWPASRLSRRLSAQVPPSSGA